MPAKKKHESCEICGKELLLYKCKYCGKAFCEQHKSPEKHQCQGMEEYRKQLAMGTIARPGISKTEDPGNKEKTPLSQMPMFVGLVLAVKVLSVIAVVVAAIFAFILLLGFVDMNTPTISWTIPVNNMTGAGVVLVNYKNATDPTYDQLVQFLKADQTVKHQYDYPNYTCADFARQLHNDAEVQGIRAGFASIDFFDTSLSYAEYDDGSGSFNPPNRTLSEGHGLNVFNTTDKGLVYVDITANTGAAAGENSARIAYVVEGKELGEIYLDQATSTDYSAYEAYRLSYLSYFRDLRDYNQKAAAYNTEIQSYGAFIPPGKRAEYNIRADQLNNQKLDLDARKSQMGQFYYPEGIVKKVNVYW